MKWLRLSADPPRIALTVLLTSRPPKRGQTRRHGQCSLLVAAIGGCMEDRAAAQHGEVVTAISMPSRVACALRVELRELAFDNDLDRLRPGHSELRDEVRRPAATRRSVARAKTPPSPAPVRIRRWRDSGMQAPGPPTQLRYASARL